MLKTIGWILFSLVCAGLVGQTFAAVDEKPKQQMRMLSAGSELWMLPEVGAVAVVKDGKLIFEVVSPTESRPKGYETVDIKQGDLIMMANGKKITGAKDIQAMYDSLAIGAELKLGIRRGEDMLITTIKKADPASLPQRRMVVKGDGPGAGQGWASKQEHAIEIDDNAKDVTPINGAGMIIGTLEKEISSFWRCSPARKRSSGMPPSRRGIRSSRCREVRSLRSKSSRPITRRSRPASRLPSRSIMPAKS